MVDAVSVWNGVLEIALRISKSYRFYGEVSLSLELGIKFNTKLGQEDKVMVKHRGRRC